ncbi:MAG: hypothetical protein FD171_700 [Actinobacteria bacterium]|nr:MAG: hypothetical protein FD171_700 [Actinomycetota bacterium]
MCYTQPPIAHVMAMTEMRSAQGLPAREGLQRLEESREARRTVHSSSRNLNRQMPE